jgi:DNA-binding transcriptional regulator YhcF (GntR family)
MDDSLHGSVDRASSVPLGTQLVERIRAAVAVGRLSAGDRLPSVRELADGAAVNVNTVRAAYARLESDGLVRSEHGRGTFVAGASPPSRAELRDQITALEATLARLPPPPLADQARPGRAALLSTDELVAVRDRLLGRLQQLDTERTALIESIEQLGFEAPAPAAPSRHATPSLAGARIRWVGAS